MICEMIMISTSVISNLKTIRLKMRSLNISAAAECVGRAESAERSLAEYDASSSEW